MLRSIVSLLACISALVVFTAGPHRAQERASDARADELEGVYEFVSESEVFTKPKEHNRTITSEDWEGRWQFCNGRFYFVMQTKERMTDNYRFGAAAGPYSIKEAGKVLLRPDITQELHHPVWLMEYRFDGDKLILKRAITPSGYNLTEGSITTVLRRMR
jgi:hypothetical protein